MKFGLNKATGERIRPEPGLFAVCPFCEAALVPKCGGVRIHHWAHRNDKMCDRWWEPETEWHRSWKNVFPAEWQEIILPDKGTGEKHIADVCTSHDLVIEFQHSPINPQERITREKFYKNMVWVVDGSRNKFGFSRFMKGIRHFEYIEKGLFRVANPEEYFHPAWLESAVPVIFDFKGSEPGEDSIVMKNLLYCLFPIRVGKYVTVAEMPRETFINSAINGKWSLHVKRFIDELNREKQEWQIRDAALRLGLC
ncbi:Competence protein CoiA-like family protein [Chitinophaga rupis]|uniref:Competence protein CoiA-like family protein n=1 Tax=Chitinophaga rupis TaxID=573321 RepID=A0A1H7RRV1_9BACT|nr:competence protein CoiA family protein [Chitinophaga rupis]SEL62943.1 Competence protein CoiA-like family protein [Chitinophaga rupis]